MGFGVGLTRCLAGAEHGRSRRGRRGLADTRSPAESGKALAKVLISALETRGGGPRGATTRPVEREGCSSCLRT